MVTRGNFESRESKITFIYFEARVASCNTNKYKQELGRVSGLLS